MFNLKGYKPIIINMWTNILTFLKYSTLELKVGYNF